MDENQEQELFHGLLGQAILQWSHVEDSLCAVFISAIGQRYKDRPGPHQLPATAAFYAAINAETKAAMANAAMTIHLQFTGAQGDQLLPEWRRLFKSVQRLQGTRNRIVHFQSLIDTGAPVGRQHILRPRLFDPNNLNKYPDWSSAPQYRVHDLEHVRRAFGLLSRKLRLFADRVALGPPEASA